MKKTLTLIAVLFALSVAPAAAQTDITGFTITEPLTSTGTTIVVSSSTGMSAGTLLYIDAEFVTIAQTYSSGTTVPIIRNSYSNARAHLDNAQGYIVPIGARVGSRLIGACVRGGTAEGEAYVLIFNMQTADIGRCAGGTLGSRTWRWTNAYDTGTPSSVPPETP